MMCAYPVQGMSRSPIEVIVAVPSVSRRVFTHSMVVVLRGDIDLSETAILRRVLVEAMRRRPRRLVIDLAGVISLDQTAVGALLAAAETAVDLDMRVVIRHAAAAVAAQLRLSGVTASIRD